MSASHLNNILEIANNDLLSIEERFKRLRTDASILQSQKHTCKRNLYQLNNQIATTSRILNSLRISCVRKRREMENLCNEKARLESIVIGFKSNNEEYLNKIKQVAEGNVKSVLTNGKILLKFAIASVIESLRSKPELCNFVLNDTDTYSNESNHLSLMLPGQQQQQLQSFSYLNDDICTVVIL